MKIALVSPYDYAYPGGVNAHLSHLEANFIQMGHQVKILAPCSNVEAMPNWENVIALGKPVPLPSSGSIARVTLSPRLGSKVKNILQEEQFDIVHLHEPLVPALPITVLRFSQSINVGTFHACHDKSRSYFYARRILKRWFRKLDGKIAVSKPAMEFISRYFAGYYNIIPNGIDVEHFSAAVPPIEEYCDGKLNILFVGRLEKRKGLNYLLGAYARIKRSFPGIRLIVVGPAGRARKTYEKTLDREGLRDVIFTGYVPYSELPRYYRSADVFCAPATGQESFGIVLLEAMSTGKAIVASNIKGYASVVTDGAEGLLVPPKEEEALALALTRLLTDPSLREQMGMKGRIKAQEYSWPLIARQVLAYYERLLNEVPNRLRDKVDAY